MIKNRNRKSGRQKMIVYKQTLNAAKHVNKHGEIKVKHASKNEKERVITGCMHHDLKKNGMPKSRVIVHQDGTCTCRMCHATFSYKSKTKKEMKDEVKPVKDRVQLAKWTAQACGAVDQKTVDMYQQSLIILDKLPKVIARQNKIYSKTKAAKKKKRNNGYDSKSGSAYGQWERN